jgi:predicted PurR-regulated permease PerM
VAVIIGYALINLAQDQLLQPVVMGSELNLSPLAIFIAVIVWVWILGAPGALLAVPLTLGLVMILEAFPSSRGVAGLFRNKVVPQPGTTG